MSKSVFLLTFIFVIACGQVTDKSPNSLSDLDSTVTITDRTASHRELTTETPPVVLVLPPYDEIANAGISPDMQKYLEMELLKDSALTVIDFPSKALMDVPFYNIYDRKYCKPILEKIKADVIVMSKLDQRLRSGNMTTDKWDVAIRIYYTATNTQLDSKVMFNNLTDSEIGNHLKLKRSELVTEIKNSPRTLN